MSLREELLDWGFLRTLKLACEDELRSLNPYEKRVVWHVNQINRQHVTKNLADGGHPPREIGDVVNPDDCFHIGDVIYHLRCTGMNLPYACKILLEAAQAANESIAMGEQWDGK